MGNISATAQSSWDVIIAGAGVGGAALALALASTYPLRILVVDRRSGPGNINRGDSLLPAVTQHLRAWGALPALYEAGARPVEKMQVFHQKAGLILEAPLAHSEKGALAPYLVLPHPEIERVLVEAARATGRVEVRYRCRLAALHGTDRISGAQITSENGDEDVQARLIVGADGASSSVRSALKIDVEHIPYDNGYYIIEVERPRNYQDAMRIELHPDGGILVVPQGIDRVGLGVLVRPAHAALFRAGPLDEKMAAIRARARLLADCRPYPRGAHLYALYRGHAGRYYARGAVLMGDAIHVTNPTAGQGMTMAIEDAAALSRHLGPIIAAHGNDAEIDACLAAYQSERFPRNQAQIRWSHWMSRFYALPGAVGDALHRSLFSLGASPLGMRIQQHLWSRMATRSLA